MISVIIIIIIFLYNLTPLLMIVETDAMKCNCYKIDNLVIHNLTFIHLGYWLGEFIFFSEYKKQKP